MKVIITVAIFTLTINAYCQTNIHVSNEAKPVAITEDTSEMSEETDNSIIKIDKSLPNGIMLYGTKMVTVKNGIIRAMEKEIILPNGTRVRPNGMVFRKNKARLLLNFGEYIDTSGNIRPMEKINSFN